MTTERAERRLAAILAADVVGYSRLVRAGEEETVAGVAALISDVIEPAIATHRGRVFKKMGDAVLAEFASSVDAVRCAVAIQHGIAARNGDAAPERRIAFRIGLHVGDVLVDGDDLQGDGVNVAARIEGLAAAGGICISEDVLHQVEGRVEAAVEDIGPQRLKNIDSPVRVYRIRPEIPWQGRVMTPLATRLRRMKWPAAAAAACMVALVVAGRMGVFPIRETVPALEPALVERMAFPLPDRPSIAVLPFENLSGDPEQAFVSDGLTENVISSLSKVSQMLVIARNSTAVYKGAAVAVKTVAEELGVRYVLTGSVQQSGDTLRVTAQLSDAVEGHQLWSERYDRARTELFKTQDDITREIMVAMQVKLTAGEQARVRAASTRNLKAWELYVKGLSRIERYTKGDNAAARELLQAAVVLDPGFAAAWRLLAWTHWLDARFAWSASRGDSFQAAAKTVEKAMDLAPEDVETFALVASLQLFQGNYDEAIAAGERAIALGPNMADVKATVAIVTIAAGDWEQTVELLSSAMRLHPRFASWYLLYLSRAYVFAGDLQSATEAAEQGLVRAESDGLHGGYYTVLAWIDVEAGKLEKAREQMAEVLKRAPGITVSTWRKRQFYRNPIHLDRIADALRRAGMPE